MFFKYFSENYQVRLLTEDDAGDIFCLCEQNPLYYRHCPPFVTKESICRDMRALPPGKSVEDKFYLGYFDKDRLVAVMDFIRGYPDSETGFIGFFMTNAAIQHKGVGSELIGELCRCLHGEGYRAIRLGWVKGNSQSENFWHKNGFQETGVTYETDNYTVIVAERKL